MAAYFSTLRLVRALMLAGCALTAPFAHSWEMIGSHRVSAVTRDDLVLPLGSVDFIPQPDGSTTFKLNIETERFTDHFLSMKEFKCLEGAEVMCHVPYPYRNPGRITPTNLAWLEHNLLFLFKQPRDFGAKLWNGLYFRFERDADGLVGLPQAIDLNLISAPPDDLNTPPYGSAQRDDVAPGARWISRLIIR